LRLHRCGDERGETAGYQAAQQQRQQGMDIDPRFDYFPQGRVRREAEDTRDHHENS
jgi:hypothetical protein